VENQSFFSDSFDVIQWHNSYRLGGKVYENRTCISTKENDYTHFSVGCATFKIQ
jgi:hypothetical protein